MNRGAGCIPAKSITFMNDESRRRGDYVIEEICNGKLFEKLVLTMTDKSVSSRCDIEGNEPTDVVACALASQTN
jgi:hypothetical protein